MPLALSFHLNKLGSKAPQDSNLTHHRSGVFSSVLQREQIKGPHALKGFSAGSSTDLWAGESHWAIKALFTLKEERQKKQVRFCFNFPLSLY